MGEPVLKTPDTSSDLGTQVLAAFKPYEAFSKAMLDAYAVVDRTGRVLKCNQLLSQLVGLATKQVLKADSLNDLIKFKVKDQALSVVDMLAFPAVQRLDEINGTAGERTDLNLIIGTFPFKDANEQVMGAFVLIRDVTAETNLQGKYKDTAIKSITDPLTGLYTRGYFEDYLPEAMKNLKQLEKAHPQRLMSVIMLDIDFFKKVNDGFGHQAGDFVIRTVAETMLATFRRADIVCRYGGEEFLAIMPGTDLEGARVAAEKLRKTIEERVFKFEEHTIPITISSGAANIMLDSEEYMSTIERADKALYESKHSGRNRVSVHDGVKITSGIEGGRKI